MVPCMRTHSTAIILTPFCLSASPSMLVQCHDLLLLVWPAAESPFRHSGSSRDLPSLLHQSPVFKEVFMILAKEMVNLMICSLIRFPLHSLTLQMNLIARSLILMIMWVIWKSQLAMNWRVGQWLLGGMRYGKVLLIINAITETAAIPLEQACINCNSTASLRCRQCGPLGFYCLQCFQICHKCVNFLHVPEEWEVVIDLCVY